jgi:hypothetical protein
VDVRIAAHVTRQLVAFLSTDPLRHPCETEEGVTQCTGFPIFANLSPNGVVISWANRGFPGWELGDHPGIPMDVGGRRAISSHTDGIGCGGLKGEDSLMVEIERPAATSNWVEFAACWRGPDLIATRNRIDALLASVVWKTPDDPPRLLPNRR